MGRVQLGLARPGHVGRRVDLGLVLREHVFVLQGRLPLLVEGVERLPFLFGGGFQGLPFLACLFGGPVGRLLRLHRLLAASDE